MRIERECFGSALRERSASFVVSSIDHTPLNLYPVQLITDKQNQINVMEEFE